MKRLLFASVGLIALTMAAQPATAADMPRPVTKAPAMVAAPIFNWSGCYIGAHAGGVWGRSNIVIPNYGDHFDIDTSSFAAGGQIGCDWQTPGNSLVLGIEGDWSWMDLDDREGVPSNAAEFIRTKWDWSAALRGRIGFAPSNTLWYVTGGAAWAHLDAANLFNSSRRPDSGTHSGWTVGAGVEHAFAPNWILGIEYLYAAYERERYNCSGGCGPVDIDLKTHTVRARVSWKFASGKTPVGKAPAVVTKY